MLLVILAVATGTLALAQHQSWRKSQLDQAALTAGADVRVTLPAPLPLDEAGSLVAARGVHTAMPVAAFNSGFSVLALGARQAAATVLAAAGPVQPAARPALAADHPRRRGTGPGPARSSGPALRRGPRGRPSGVAQPGSGSGGLGAAHVSLSVQDGSGIVYAVPAGRYPPTGRTIT